MSAWISEMELNRFIAWKNLLLSLSGTNPSTWELLGVFLTAKFVEIKVEIEEGKYSDNFWCKETLKTDVLLKEDY